MRKSINLPKKHNKSEAASKDAASFHLGGGKAMHASKADIQHNYAGSGMLTLWLAHGNCSKVRLRPMRQERSFFICQ